MEIDQTTYYDLSLLNSEEDHSIFNQLNLCSTAGGSHQLLMNFTHPFSKRADILGIQETIRTITEKLEQWPSAINNGSVMMIEKFYQATIDEIPAHPNAISAFNYKLFHGPDHSLVKYSTEHCFNFLHGLKDILQTYSANNTPVPLKNNLDEIKETLAHKELKHVFTRPKFNELTPAQQLQLARFIRYHFKHAILRLLELYYQLDAWYGMAKAMKAYRLHFPEITTGESPYLSAKGMYHLLLDAPVAYDIQLDPSGNFIFLTGANMAGKSTFIKSIGISVFLAHIGMGVPAREMKLSIFDGLLSNINVTDNLLKGESYFYNEVQRIKSTISKVSGGKKWLILIDELFKGTNVEDAIKCSVEVIRGLLKMKQSFFILSTHLYEIGEEMKNYPNINFRYFQTLVKDGQLIFNYELKEGISNDRLGYLILQNEGIVKMLHEL